MAAKEFKGRTALVTGGASGIGAATVRAFCEAGASVVIADIQDTPGEILAKTLREKGHKVKFVHCDMLKEADIRGAIKLAVSEYGGLHHAFNNAGIEGETGTTAECNNKNWDAVTGINLRGVWWCMKHEIPALLAAGGGTIVNCASIAGLVGFQNIPAYVASKHGVVGLTRAAALEYAAQKIRVNAVCPGVIETPMIERFTGNDPDARAGLVASEPIGRMGQPEEIAAAVVWLSGPGSSFTTGQALAVDGGWVAQ